MYYIYDKVEELYWKYQSFFDWFFNLKKDTLSYTNFKYWLILLYIRADIITFNSCFSNSVWVQIFISNSAKTVSNLKNYKMSAKATCYETDANQHQFDISKQPARIDKPWERTFRYICSLSNVSTAFFFFFLFPSNIDLSIGWGGSQHSPARSNP